MLVAMRDRSSMCMTPITTLSPVSTFTLLHFATNSKCYLVIDMYTICKIFGIDDKIIFHMLPAPVCIHFT